jgi:hypothetical protein
MAEICERIQNTEETGELVMLNEEKVRCKLAADREMSWYLWKELFSTCCGLSHKVHVVCVHQKQR